MNKLSAKILNQSYKLNRYVIIMMFDLVMMAVAYLLALLARFNFNFAYIPTVYLGLFGYAFIPIAVFGIASLWLCRSYHIIWRFASSVDLRRLLIAFVLQQILLLPTVELLNIVMPRTFWLIGAVLEIIGLALVRFSYRFLRDWSMTESLTSKRKIETNNIMVIGAGSAGRLLIREMRENPSLNLTPVCIIDDNTFIKNKTIDGVPVKGTRDDIITVAKAMNIKEIILAIPSVSNKNKQEILRICQQTKAKTRVVPGIYELVDGRVSVSKLKDVSLEDLLGRDPVKIDNDAIHRFLSGKVVMVTGGGGSIGSELCRQIAQDQPKQLIIFDIYENNAYAIEQELKRKYPNLNLLTLIGSVRDVAKIDDVFATYRPEIVYHAAAHKHVPLMENAPHEAIKNNVFGTYNVAKAALKYKAKRFLLISTDKAVNPTNIMGASKRLCEMLVQMMDRKSQALGDEYPTHYSAVRFGNVLGSNGSVVPLFKKQIQEGGPVTVTDKRIVRYFMTIPEAVSLVLQSSFYAQGGEIFVLDMGDPVKIDDMARNLIRLSGYEPDVDIKIVYTGLRPGEKLYEEMLMSEEGLKSTENKLIHIGEPIEMDDKVFEDHLDILYKNAYDEHSDIKACVAGVLTTYHPELGAK